MVCVFNFCFCKRGFAGGAPVNRFHPFFNVAFFVHVAENSDLFCFVFRRNRQIWMLPVTPDTEAFEFAFLTFKVFISKFSALLAEFVRRYGTSAAFDFFYDFVFNRKPVPVVSRNVWRIKTFLGFVFCEDIF